MTSDELRNLLTIAGIASRIAGDEVLVETCVFCGNDKHNLELNATKGVFGCWACKSGGRLETLLFTLTGQRHSIPVDARIKERRKKAPVASSDFKMVPISMVPSAEMYLKERGIDAAIADSYGLHVCVEETHPLYGRIAIPVVDFWSYKAVGWIGRSYIGQRPKYLSTAPYAAISGWRWRSKQAPVVLVEGHLDGIAVHQAGCTAAVIGGLHAPTLTDWAARIPPETPIVVMLDGDAQKEAEKLFWQLVMLRDNVRVAALAPGQDPSMLGPDLVRELMTVNGT